MASVFTKKAPIEMLCLTLLQERDMYSYEMAQMIKQRSNGAIVVAEAALYMVVYKLQEKGYISDRRETLEGLRPRVRVYYHLEASGEAYLQEIRSDYLKMAQGVLDFLHASEGGQI